MRREIRGGTLLLEISIKKKKVKKVKLAGRYNISIRKLHYKVESNPCY